MLYFVFSFTFFLLAFHYFRSFFNLFYVCFIFLFFKYIFLSLLDLFLVHFQKYYFQSLFSFHNRLFILDIFLINSHLFSLFLVRSFYDFLSLSIFKELIFLLSLTEFTLFYIFHNIPAFILMLTSPVFFSIFCKVLLLFSFVIRFLILLFWRRQP